MKVYHLNHLGSRTHRSLIPTDDPQIDILAELTRLGQIIDGRSIYQNWKSPHVIYPSSESHLPLGDLMYFILGPVISSHSANILDDMLFPNGEFCPMEMPFGTPQSYFFFNVTRLSDALNYEDSIFGDGKNQIQKYSFHRDKIEGLTIFKLSQIPRRNVYITDKFLDAVDSSNLTGFNPRLVWSDDS